MTVKKTTHDNFAKGIGLKSSWPSYSPTKSEMSHKGHLNWAASYLEAAEILVLEEKTSEEFSFYAGPIMQLVGLSTELILKCLLRGGGVSETELRKFSHNTYNAYYQSRENFDEVKFLDLCFSNMAHLHVPKDIEAKLLAAGEANPDLAWKVYFNHLRNLDTVYDRPFRNRYVTPGSVTLPDVEIVLIGSKILLQAMINAIEMC